LGRRCIEARPAFSLKANPLAGIPSEIRLESSEIEVRSQFQRTKYRPPIQAEALGIKF